MAARDQRLDWADAVGRRFNGEDLWACSCLHNMGGPSHDRTPAATMGERGTSHRLVAVVMGLPPS
ncbi:hypothetical protein ACLOJK_006077, partial [Asimina triloba]